MYKNHFGKTIVQFMDSNFHHDSFDGCSFGSLYIDIDFSRATFTNCDMSCSRFLRCNFAGAEFHNCNLAEAKFDGSNLYSCRFKHCEGDLLEYRTGKVLTEDLIGYKCALSRSGGISCIVKLKIPRGAIMFSINGHKCRTNMVEVLDIYNVYNESHENVAYSIYNGMSYYVGDKITVYDFNCGYNVECGKGIHFFMDEESAINYAY